MAETLGGGDVFLREMDCHLHLATEVPIVIDDPFLHFLKNRCVAALILLLEPRQKTSSVVDCQRMMSYSGIATPLSLTSNRRK
ncbi:MAG: hypothetical protein HN348_15535 [Proteobacteria bacterium]|nr:hypothetical protein [Pseudomonadota bacterium]